MNELASLQVVYEDNHLIAVNKPAGLLVHADVTGDLTLADLVKNFIKIRYGKPGDVFLGVIHRLDRPVSGLVFFARTSKGLSRMNALFKKREVEKTYLAVTSDRPFPETGTLKQYIVKDREKNKARVYDQKSRRSRDAKLAVLDYELVAEIEGKCLIKVMLATGRPHQIRAQLASIGCPIVGDLKYGYSRSNRDQSIHLHSYQMAFLHPVKQEPVKVTVPPPKDQIWNKFREILNSTIK